MVRRLKRLHGVHPQRVEHNRLYPILACSVAIIVIVLGFVVFTRNDDPLKDFIPQVTGAPRIALAEEVHDHGDIPVNTTIESVFKVQNVGDEPLTILGEPQVEVIEGCCPNRAEVGEMTLEPGEETEIKLQMEMHKGMGGPHEFRIHLRTNDPVEPLKDLTILSNWIE